MKLSFEDNINFAMIESTHCSIEIKTVDFGIAVCGAADYILENGISFGAEVGFSVSIYADTRTIVGFMSQGFGFSLALEIAYTNTSKNTWQIIWQPIILKKIFINDKNGTIFIGNKETTGQIETTATDLKTGIRFSYEWKTKKSNKNEFIGLVLGLNYNLFHQLKDDDDAILHNGVEFIIGLKTFLIL